MNKIHLYLFVIITLCICFSTNVVFGEQSETIIVEEISFHQSGYDMKYISQQSKILNLMNTSLNSLISIHSHMHIDEFIDDKSLPIILKEHVQRHYGVYLDITNNLLTYTCNETEMDYSSFSYEEQNTINTYFDIVSLYYQTNNKLLNSIEKIQENPDFETSLDIYEHHATELYSATDSLISELCDYVEIIDVQILRPVVDPESIRPLPMVINATSITDPKNADVTVNWCYSPEPNPRTESFRITLINGPHNEQVNVPVIDGVACYSKTLQAPYFESIMDIDIQTIDDTQLSEPYSIHLEESRLPFVPLNVSYSQDYDAKNNLTLNWDYPYPRDGIRGWVVEHGTSPIDDRLITSYSASNMTRILGGDVNSIKISDLESGPHYFRVTAVSDSMAYSYPSTLINATITPLKLDIIPLSNTSAILSWTLQTSDSQHDQVTSYVIKYTTQQIDDATPNDEIYWNIYDNPIVKTTTSVILTNLDDKQNIVFKINAVHEDDSTSSSSRVSYTPPQNLQLVDITPNTALPTLIFLNVTNSVDFPEDFVLNNILFKYSDDGGEFWKLKILNGTGTVIQFDRLVSGNTYHFKASLLYENLNTFFETNLSNIITKTVP